MSVSTAFPLLIAIISDVVTEYFFVCARVYKNADCALNSEPMSYRDDDSYLLFRHKWLFTHKLSLPLSAASTESEHHESFFFSRHLLFFKARHLGNGNEGLLRQVWSAVVGHMRKNSLSFVQRSMRRIHRGSGPPGIPLLWRFADISHRWLTFSQHVDEGVNDIPPVRGQMILDSHSTESPSSRGMLTPRWQDAAQAVKCVFRGCFGRNNRRRERIQGKLKLRLYIFLFLFLSRDSRDYTANCLFPTRNNALLDLPGDWKKIKNKTVSEDRTNTRVSPLWHNKGMVNDGLTVFWRHRCTCILWHHSIPYIWHQTTHRLKKGHLKRH